MSKSFTYSVFLVYYIANVARKTPNDHLLETTIVWTVYFYQIKSIILLKYNIYYLLQFYIQIFVWGKYFTEFTIFFFLADKYFQDRTPQHKKINDGIGDPWDSSRDNEKSLSE